MRSCDANLRDVRQEDTYTHAQIQGTFACPVCLGNIKLIETVLIATTKKFC